MGHTHGRKWTDADDAALIELHRAGVSMTAAARQMGRPTSTVALHARQLSLSWGSARAAAAAEAWQAQCRRMRDELQRDLLISSQRLNSQLFKPTTVFNFGGKDNTFEKRDIAEPTYADKRAIVAAATNALNGSIRIAEHDADSGTESTVAMLAELGKALGIVQPPDVVE